MHCPECGEELDDEEYCIYCGWSCEDDEFDDDDFDNEDEFDDDFSEDEDEDEDFSEDDLDDENCCSNCTYWDVNPQGAAYGMMCYNGHGETDPDDSCCDFEENFHSSSYGENGEYSFIDTDMDNKRKLDYWKRSR